MRSRVIVLGLLALLVAHPVHAASPRMGVAQLGADGSVCVKLKGTPPRTGEPFWIMLFNPPRVVDGALMSRMASSCGNPQQTEGDAYLGKTRFAFNANEVGIAVFCAGAHVEYAEGQFILKTPDAKTPLSFRMCASEEGLHLTTWRENRRTWHAYVYMSMDLEANCTDEEARE